MRIHRLLKDLKWCTLSYNLQIIVSSYLGDSFNGRQLVAHILNIIPDNLVLPVPITW